MQKEGKISKQGHMRVVQCTLYVCMYTCTMYIPLCVRLKAELVMISEGQEPKDFCALIGDKTAYESLLKGTYTYIHLYAYLYIHVHTVYLYLHLYRMIIIYVPLLHQLYHAINVQ